MENIKKILKILIIIIIIIIILLILFKYINSKSTIDEVEAEYNLEINNSLERVSTRNNYFSVKNIIDKYYSALCKLNETSEGVLIFEQDEEVEHLEEENSQAIEKTKKRICGYFDEKYIKETSLSSDNLQEKLGSYNNLYVLIEDMYVREISLNINLYFVFGTITEKETLKSEKFQLMIATDSNNSTFNIYTSDYIEKHKLFKLSQEENLSEELLKFSQIENRTYNKYDYKIIDDETYAKELLKNYTQSIKYNNINYSYENLNEEYKTSRFEKKSDYENYVLENKKNIIISNLKFYKDNKYDGYRQYICIDQNGNYYIFNETAIMNYELILDTYTIDLPEFTEKYETATTEERVMLNIQKIVEAINAKDYKYVYGKLADEFKANYFKTYEEFEKYAKNEFDIGNEVTFNRYTESENYSTYGITLKGKNKTITKTIVMRLDVGTNFVMSFNVN